jgi:hypothetical protein
MKATYYKMEKINRAVRNGSSAGKHTCDTPETEFFKRDSKKVSFPELVDINFHVCYILVEMLALAISNKGKSIKTRFLDAPR